MKNRSSSPTLPLSRSPTPVSIHMVGVGGVGMSGLALLLREMGFPVTGSDLKNSDTVGKLKQAGIRVCIGHHVKNVPSQARLLAYSSAVRPNNPEILEAKKRGIAILNRGQLLAEISRLKKTITVSGSHGNTTTSSMAGWVLSQAGLHPTG